MRRQILHVLPRDLVPVVAAEGEHARAGAEERHAQRVDVGAAVQGLPARLFRGEVLRRAHDHVRAGLFHVAAHGARDPEIGDDRVAVLVEEDVVGLDVAVDHPFPVREGERGGDVHAEPDEQRLGEGAEHLEAAIEAGWEVVHDEEDRGPLAAHGEDTDDVRVAELGGDRGLVPEARLEGLFARELGLEDLDGHRDVELGVVALVDPGEAAGADDGVDAEAAEVAIEISFRHGGRLYRGVERD